jgi:hypothetical protein
MDAFLVRKMFDVDAEELAEILGPPQPEERLVQAGQLPDMEVWFRDTAPAA